MWQVLPSVVVTAVLCGYITLLYVWMCHDRAEDRAVIEDAHADLDRIWAWAHEVGDWMIRADAWMRDQAPEQPATEPSLPVTEPQPRPTPYPREMPELLETLTAHPAATKARKQALLARYTHKGRHAAGPVSQEAGPSTGLAEDGGKPVRARPQRAPHEGETA